MQLYARVAWFSFSSFITYPFELLASLLKPFVGLGLQLVFWAIVVASAPGTISYRSLVAYFLIGTGITTLVLANDFKFGSFLARAIKFGTINSKLIKPVSVPQYVLAECLGQMGVRWLVAAGFVISGMLIQPPRDVVSLGIGLLLLVEAACVSYGLNLAIGTVAFYTTEASGIKNVVTHISGVFSGLIVPLALFPPLLRGIALWLPFAALTYAPASVLSHSSFATDPLMSLLRGGLWSVVLVVGARWWWQRSLRNYEAVGL